MKTPLYTRLAGWLCVLALILSACHDDDYTSAGANGETKAANITISVSGLAEKDMSRVNSERIDRSQINRLDIVLADGNTVKKILRSDSATDLPPIDAGNYEQTGLVNGSFPVIPPDGTTTGIKLRISQADMQGVSDIYLVANYISYNNNVLAPLPNVRTVAELKNLPQGSPNNADQRLLCTMFGHISMATSPSQPGEEEKLYTAQLTRTIAMITVAVEESEDLVEGVRVIPRQLCLHHVPSLCRIGTKNAINRVLGDGETLGDGDIPWSLNGRLQSVAWGEIRGNGAIDPVLGGHGNDAEVLPLYMFENQQGVNTDYTGDQVGKTPPAGVDPRFCSYLEMEADYYYVPADGGQQYAGRIKYRLYLGDNITNDFNIKRNHHYQVTLQLHGMAGLVEDGRFMPDGTWQGTEEGGASWRIESTVSNAGFIDESTNIPVSGSTARIPFVREDGEEYIIYCSNEGAMDVSWLKTEVGMPGASSGWTGTPTQEYPAIPKQDGETGQWYIELYAKPFTHDEWSRVHEDIENWTIQDWITKGYREEPMVLAKRDRPDDPISTVTIRQWIPLPVMEPGVSKPFEANLYFSRIDVLHGEALRWAPDYYDNVDVPALIAAESGKLGTFTGDATSYSKAFGFHNVAAMYVVDRMRGGKHFAHSDPTTAMDIAAYRAGNSTGNSDEMSAPYTQMLYYGLPSVEEWQKIKQYGIEDYQFPFAATEYWTSTMDGTQSYTYDYVTGVDRKVGRDELHRVRLVYHKLDSWIAPYPFE